jgi:GNAT superfamily N-acetyltransferase
MLQTRIADPEADFPHIAKLLSGYEFVPVTTEQLHEWERRRSEGRVRRRGVAVDRDDQVIGYSVVDREAWMPAGRFGLWLIVDPRWRGQGAGAALYREALDFARQHGALSLSSEVRDDSPESLAFAERRGFHVEQHTFTSALDLAAFDQQRLAGVIEAVEAGGMRFFTLAEVGNTPETQRRLYDLNRRTGLDNPGADGTFPPFDQFEQFVFGASWFRADGQILAADGERWVGLAAVALYPDRNLAYNAFTGVDREYRGRGLAQALKLLAARYALAQGASTIATDNDSRNAPMLAINRKLGYRPEPGKYLLVRDMQAQDAMVKS